MKDTDKINLEELAKRIFEKDKEISSEHERKKHFRKIGRIGGLKNRKSGLVKEKYLKVRMTENELENLQQKAKENDLNLSEYSRLILFNRELKINEFKTKKILLEIVRNFKWITNLLRQKEWNQFENKTKILAEIELTISMTRDFLTSKNELKNE